MGKYRASFGGADSSNNFTNARLSISYFDVYSSTDEKYSVGDNVYVIVPQNDFSQ